MDVLARLALLNVHALLFSCLIRPLLYSLSDVSCFCILSLAYCVEAASATAARIHFTVSQLAATVAVVMDVTMLSSERCNIMEMLLAHVLESCAVLVRLELDLVETLLAHVLKSGAMLMCLGLNLV